MNDIEIFDYIIGKDPWSVFLGFHRGERISYKDYPDMDINLFMSELKEHEFVVSDDENEFWTIEMLESYILED